jgi:ArsR family transcriptional regulator
MQEHKVAAAKPGKPVLKSGLPVPDYEKLAVAFSALAHPIRLRILEVLMTAHTCTLAGKCCVTDIHTLLNLPQPVVSKHLKILKERNILSYERVANKIYYSFTKANACADDASLAKDKGTGNDNLLHEIFRYVSACCKCC